MDEEPIVTQQPKTLPTPTCLREGTRAVSTRLDARSYSVYLRIIGPSVHTIVPLVSTASPGDRPILIDSSSEYNGLVLPYILL